MNSANSLKAFRENSIVSLKFLVEIYPSYFHLYFHWCLIGTSHHYKVYGIVLNKTINWSNLWRDKRIPFDVIAIRPSNIMEVRVTTYGAWTLILQVFSTLWVHFFPVSGPNWACYAITELIILLRNKLQWQRWKPGNSSSVNSVLLEEIRKFWLDFAMVVYEKIFGSINEQLLQLTQTLYCTIISYIRNSQAMLKFFLFTQGCPWYSQISNSGYGCWKNCKYQSHVEKFQ